jgi:hypothetical protein
VSCAIRVWRRALFPPAGPPGVAPRAAAVAAVAASSFFASSSSLSVVSTKTRFVVRSVASASAWNNNGQNCTSRASEKKQR